MNPAWEQLLRQLGHQLDQDVLPALYVRAGRPTQQIRDALAQAGLSYADPQVGLIPDALALERAAQRVIKDAGLRGGLTGGIAGFGGALAIPPEVASTLVQTLRLAQMLAVIYGHDPQSEAGRHLLLRALAEAFEVELPQQSRLGTRLSDVAETLRTNLPDVQRAPVLVARTALLRAAVSVGGRFSRFVPGVGAGLSAWDGRRRMLVLGERIHAFYRRRYDGAVPLDGPVEDAVEVPG